MLFGAKRWALYPGAVPPPASYNPTESHLTWMKDVYPDVKDSPELAPLECVQRAGDIIYVPEGWHHATVNLGDTGAIARRPEEFTPGSPREIKERAAKAVNAAHWGKDPKTTRQDAEAAVALANEAVALDPVEGDHHMMLGHAYNEADRADEATVAYEKAVELHPRHPGVYLALGQFQNDKQEWSRAAKTLSRGTELLDTAGDDNRMAAELRKQLKKARQQRKLGGRKARAAARDL